MTEAQNDWDLERVQVHNLAAAVLLEQAPTAPAGRAALTLIPGAGAALQQTLLALWEACSWPNTTRLGWRLQVLRGRVRTGGRQRDWGWAWVITSRSAHEASAESLEDASILLTVAATQSS